jgi:hypothetical protein
LESSASKVLRGPTFLVKETSAGVTVPLEFRQKSIQRNGSIITPGVSGKMFLSVRISDPKAFLNGLDHLSRWVGISIYPGGLAVRQMQSIAVVTQSFADASYLQLISSGLLAKTEEGRSRAVVKKIRENHIKARFIGTPPELVNLLFKRVIMARSYMKCLAQSIRNFC